jgi:hypothetical protein
MATIDDAAAAARAKAIVDIHCPDVPDGVARGGLIDAIVAAIRDEAATERAACVEIATGYARTRYARGREKTYDNVGAYALLERAAAGDAIARAIRARDGG